jgi:hypothetical protein
LSVTYSLNHETCNPRHPLPLPLLALPGRGEEVNTRTITALSTQHEDHVGGWLVPDESVDLGVHRSKLIDGERTNLVGH